MKIHLILAKLKLKSSNFLDGNHLLEHVYSIHHCNQSTC